MNAGRTTWVGLLLVVLLVGTLGLLALFALAGRDVRAARGEELLCEDVGFRLLDVGTAERVGAPGSERPARGLFRIVRLEIANHTQDEGYDPAWHHALLLDASGRLFQVDPDATQALRAAESAPAVPARLAQGERCVTPLVYDVPADARGLTLRIAWEIAALPNFVDQVVHGDRRLLLEEAR